MLCGGHISILAVRGTLKQLTVTPTTTAVSIAPNKTTSPTSQQTQRRPVHFYTVSYVGSMTHMPVVHGLRPSSETQARQDLRLDLQRQMLIAEDVVDPQRKTRNGPEYHHRRRQTLGRGAFVIEPYLR